MLPPAVRMRSSADFAQTIRRGARAGRTTLVVHGRVSERPGVRVGFVVSKAVGGAVVRNVVRRRLRGLVMEQLDTVPSGTDVVVRALPAAATADYATLGADLRSALSQSLRRAGAS
ncbi:ribonuclease P protein component [Actinotalea sp. M2MS4P-6]|uniref:ribonuclease P protein component n=1 Tax=Actinotalea sp. M2MS4P-6 TaxID=2983762 RepID=UPI0021E3A465|nr:ribonuclease P protein component [Actinotalea sp. M2MS4P-6]MCV2392843.1 ribonuclease P protein component [Actinotalea sp. M2MS4P-6]